jgi:hypothetical protein
MDEPGINTVISRSLSCSPADGKPGELPGRFPGSYRDIFYLDGMVMCSPDHQEKNIQDLPGSFRNDQDGSVGLVPDISHDTGLACAPGNKIPVPDILDMAAGNRSSPDHYREKEQLMN